MDTSSAVNQMMRVAKGLENGLTDHYTARLYFQTIANDIVAGIESTGLIAVCDDEDYRANVVPSAEMPKDFDPAWVEIGEDDFPVDSDDADYVKEVL
jgi:hypothetical protein